jgi:FkbM family methyltransferase
MKQTKNGFYCACDHVYFTTLAKQFVRSCQEHAPWAHIHLHIFDGTQEDQEWCQRMGCSVTVEPTPEEYCESEETKKAYWVNTRFIRLPELYEDYVKVIAIDADSIFVRELTEQQFEDDLSVSWVTIAGKREQKSLGSAVGFGPDFARKTLARRLKEESKLEWYLDQKILDQMLNLKDLAEMDIRYSDFHFEDNSYIWTGKGDRKLKNKFTDLLFKYQQKFILDGGTHLGQGLREIMKIHPTDDSWEIHTWEANPYTYKEYTSKHKISKVNSYNQALSDHKGIIKLNIETAAGKYSKGQIAPIGQGSSVLELSKWKAGPHIGVFDECVRVPCIDFAYWIKKNCSKDDFIVLKLDIEGAEYQVLSHMIEEDVLDWIDELYIEWHARMINDQDLLDQEAKIRSKILESDIKLFEWH